MLTPARSAMPAPPQVGRKPSVTTNAFALYELLVDVDHLLCSGGASAAADPGSGRGGRDPPDTTEPSLLAL